MERNLNMKRNLLIILALALIGSVFLISNVDASIIILNSSNQNNLTYDDGYREGYEAGYTVGKRVGSDSASKSVYTSIFNVCRDITNKDTSYTKIVDNGSYAQATLKREEFNLSRYTEFPSTWIWERCSYDNSNCSILYQDSRNKTMNGSYIFEYTPLDVGFYVQGHVHYINNSNGKRGVAYTKKIGI